MLTPIEIQGKVFKSGIGYDKKDVDSFCKELLLNYETLYKENVELGDKISVLNDGIQYYKTIEKTLQKALFLAEKTAEETKEAAYKKAKAIEKEAHAQANSIIVDAKNELNRVHFQTIELVQQYNKYKIQFEKLAETQIELLNSSGFNIDIANLDTMLAMGSKNLNKLFEKEEDLASGAEVKEIQQESTTYLSNTNPQGEVQDKDTTLSMNRNNNEEESNKIEEDDFEFINLNESI